MIYEQPQLTPAKTGSDARLKALRLERDKMRPNPIEGGDSMPTKYGTTPKQDKMNQALQLLGAGQSFPNSPTNQPPTGADDEQS